MSEKIKPILHTFEICDKAEMKNGKRTFHGLFIYINVYHLPVTHPFFNVVLGFSKGKGIFQGKLTITNPSNTELTNVDFEIKLEDKRVLLYQQVNIKDLQLIEMGEYTINVYIDGEKIADRQFVVLVEAVPELKSEEIEKLLKEDGIAKVGRMVFRCPKCKTEYKFQLNLDPKEPVDKDAIVFPPDNKFKCPNDGYEVDLTGIKISMQKVLGRPLPENHRGNPNS